MTAAALAVLGLVITFVFAERPSQPELTWSSDGNAGSTSTVSRGTTVKTNVLGIPLPGELDVGRGGRFTVPQNLAVFAAGPVDALAGPDQVGTLARSGDPWWRPIATVPGAFLVLAMLFAFAYAESQMRSLRRGSGGLRFGELLGLTGIGVTFGLALGLLAWVSGRTLAWPQLIPTMICLAAAFGLLAFAIAARRGPAPGRKT
ncbi:hypothetical protein EKO23_19700 [Nocardioides guangzhouensis]|uniref:Uncharacterized protein n=1 Tax=Nocardioides guangzhouensis TaxID=2497878 RepID=A0A4Q4Z660_9ACTN|nr:hypothetical protein EKO23_19700 [Nocardioides guangzhouensis]